MTRQGGPASSGGSPGEGGYGAMVGPLLQDDQIVEFLYFRRAAPNGEEGSADGEPTQAPPIKKTGVAFPATSQPLSPMMGDSGARRADRYRLAQAPTQAPSTDEAQDPLAASSSEDGQQTLGEAPEETTTHLQFLRRQSVLLDPGQYQIDVTAEYLIDEADFAMLEIEDDVLRIGEAKRRQRLLLVPLEFRLGLCNDTQVFVNVPFGWSNSEFSFAGTDTFGNTGGIGDVSAGLTRVLVQGNEICPDILGNLAFSAPTGQSDIVTSLSTPGSSLGEGFWTLMMGLTFIHTCDPVVLFYGFGYRHRFENDFDDGITVEPGKQAFYRLGAGFAVNPRVTLSASFLGSYIAEDRVNGVRVAGGIREPMTLRFAATIVRDRCKDKDKCKSRRPARTVEPFVRFGLTEDAVDSLIGISWTR